LAAEVHRQVDQRGERLGVSGFDVGVHDPGFGRERMRAQRQARDHSETAPAAALQGPQQIGLVAAVDGADAAVGGDHFSLDQARRGRSEALGIGAEPAARDQPGDADGRAAAALDVASAFGRYGSISLLPDEPRAEADGWPFRVRAAAWPERVVERDAGQIASPDEQRIRCIRRAVIAVARSLHRQAKVMARGEVDRGGDVGGASRGDRVGARLRHPGIYPAERLGQRRIVADQIRVDDCFEHSIAARTAGRRAGLQRRDRSDQAIVDIGIEPRPLRRARPAGHPRTRAPPWQRRSSEQLPVAAGQRQGACRKRALDHRTTVHGSPLCYAE
jgi:hypothetical protein